MPNFETEIKYLPGVGPKRAEILEKDLKIRTLEDLIYCFPFKYIDKTKFYKVSEITADSAHIQAKGIITKFKINNAGKKEFLTAEFSDETGSFELIWFKGVKWIKENIAAGKEYIIFGKPSFYNKKLNIAHPEIEEPSKIDPKTASSMESAYNTTETMKSKFLNSKAIRKLIQTAFNLIDSPISETLPNYLLEKYKLLGLKESLFNIHFPQDVNLLKRARYRLKFEELFYIQLNILKLKVNRKNTIKGFIFAKVADNFNNFYKNNLPFELTNAQKKVIKEIRADFSSGKQSNRLLQGDVGSGKTLVALMSMLIATDNDYQACMMAPTELLAIQHFRTITKMLENSNVKVELLTGSTKAKNRIELHEKLQNGYINILIGTHALIEDTVQFKNLGLVIIDEQHRFGVEQRAKMWKKNTNPPHVIVMTATPIPRTLAMTVYGDLDVSIIDELPPGRKSIQTIHSYDAKRLQMFKFLKDQIALGRQIYIVFPLIKESEKWDYKDLEDGLESISRAFPPPDYAISVVHGKMKSDEKEKAMQLFIKGVTNIMIATTVIEVGVDVPNASVMVIESAERFGLSQLHQLRGRVGRGADQSYCILMTSYKLSKDAQTRINTMVESNDGFKITDVDMKLRGYGDIEGTQQSGEAFELKIANLYKDGEILIHAKNVANDILDDDSFLEKEENSVLLRQLKKNSLRIKNWSVVS